MLWAACCTCFFGFLRSGEVIVPSPKEYDPEYHLSEGDVAIDNLATPNVIWIKIEGQRPTHLERGFQCNSVGQTRNYVQWGL